MPSERPQPLALAQSCQRLFAQAMGADKAPEWDRLSHEAQALWCRLALGGEQVLENCEGGTYRDAARKLARRAFVDDQLGDQAVHAPRDLLAWEAVTRHLMCVFDEADGFDLSASEEMWVGWARERRPAPVAPVDQEAASAAGR